MDETDEEFLKKFNVGQSVPCSDDEFEMVMSKFEEIILEKQPFLSMDPSQVLTFKELGPLIIEQITEAENDPANQAFLLASISTCRKKKQHRKSDLMSFKQFGELIYPHWKQRKIERKGKQIGPMLKFEESERDDGDPYVCFRRREVRQVRKTRRADAQSSEKLRKMLSEMESVKQLMEMVTRRETMRREALQLEMNIFESRCKMKDLKRSLNIREDDEDLVAHKKRKNVAAPVATKQSAELLKPVQSTTTPTIASQDQNGTSQQQQQVASSTGNPIHPVLQIPPNVRLPASKIPDMDLVSLEHVLNDKENAIKSAVKDKLRARLSLDKEWVNCTDNPYIPYCDYFDTDETSRNALNIIQPEHAAFSSIATSYPPTPNTYLNLPLSSNGGVNSRLEANPYVMVTEFTDDADLKVLSTTTDHDGPWPSGGRHIPRGTSVSLRRRTGRGGRIMVDRKGLIRRPRGIDQMYTDKKEKIDEELSSWTGLVTFSNDGTNDSLESVEVFNRLERLDDRYKYDSDVHFDGNEYPGSDPSRLNGISEETQSIRFGSMLMSKAYDSYWDAYKQRQQQLSMMHKMLQQQQQQQQQHQLQLQQQTQLQNNEQNSNPSTFPSSFSSSFTLKASVPPLPSQNNAQQANITSRNQYQTASYSPQQSTAISGSTSLPLNLAGRRPNMIPNAASASQLPVSGPNAIRSGISASGVVPQTQRLTGYDMNNNNNMNNMHSINGIKRTAQYGTLNKAGLIGMRGDGNNSGMVAGSPNNLRAGLPLPVGVSKPIVAQLNNQ